MICLSFLLAFLAGAELGLAGNNTITDEIYFDVKIEGKKSDSWRGRFVIGVFGDALPMTSFNFIELAKGFKHRDELWTYKHCLVHRVVPDFLIQTGDVIFKDGRSGRSVYAPYFIDEDFVHSHRAPGFVAMANTGVDTNNSQFYISLTKARWLDGKNVVFGKVIKGMDTVRKISEVRTNDWAFPENNVEIRDCGLLPLSEPYDLSEEDLDKSGDIRPGPMSPDFVEL